MGRAIHRSKAKIVITKQHLRGGIGIGFGGDTWPQGRDIAASLIPAHEALSAQGYTSRFRLPFARKAAGGIRLAMGLDGDGRPMFAADKLADHDPLTLELRELALFETEEADALQVPVTARRAAIEVRPYNINTDARHRTLTLGGRIGGLVVTSDIPGLHQTPGQQPDFNEEARVVALTSAREMTEIVSATMLAQLAEFQPEEVR